MITPGMFCTRFTLRLSAALLGIVLFAARPLAAQTSGTVRGRVVRADNAAPLAGVRVTIPNTAVRDITDETGMYVLEQVPAGRQVVLARWLGFTPSEDSVTVTAGETVALDFALEAQPIRLSTVMVEGASRAPERIVEAPAAIAVVEPTVARDLSVTGQAPLALATLPGVDVGQNSLADFNVNSRGFNSGFGRRVVLLQDGRDAGLVFLGVPLWSGLNRPLDGRFEMVRGPGSALYGPNAYLGVVNYITPSVRERVGTRITVAGGQLNSYRADFRHGLVAGDDRYGLLIDASFQRSDAWSRSRTSADGGDERREYAAATPDPVADIVEAVPLLGQTLDPVTRAALGDPDPYTALNVSIRFDNYRSDGSVITAEAGSDQLRNAVFAGGPARFAADFIHRPWARLNWGADRFNIMAWWTGEYYVDPSVNLGSGTVVENSSNVVHLEAQFNHDINDSRGQLVAGASVRNYRLNSKGTLIGANDNRDDRYYALFGQFDYRFTPELRLVTAARLDGGDIFDLQFSPKVGLVFSPTRDHSFRITFNSAFLTPAYTSLFLDLPAAPAANLSALEAGLRASALGPALAGVGAGDLFTNSAAVPVLAQGNSNLNVERVAGWEVGYKGQLGDRVFVTVDVYYNRMSQFVSDLLPGVNPTYPAWTAPDAVPEALRSTVEQTVRTLLGPSAPLLSRRPDGSTAMILSYTNVGRVETHGVEFGLGANLTPELRVDATYTLFRFAVDSASFTGNRIEANTPEHKGYLSLSYTGTRGFDGWVSARLVAGHPYLDGSFDGRVPSSQTINAGAGYRIGQNLRFHVIATNLLDQRRFHMYGGAVIGRQVLGGVTATL